MNASSLRYAAKAAYQLCLMRGLYHSTQLGKLCLVDCSARIVTVLEGDKRHSIKIAACWSSL